MAAVRRWNCFCGATGNAGQFCPWCGRRDPGVEPPPLPAPPAAQEQAPAVATDAPPAPPALSGAEPAAPAPIPLFAPPAAETRPDTAGASFAPPPPTWSGDHLGTAMWAPPPPPRVGLTPATRMIGTVLVLLLGIGVLTADRRVDERPLNAIRSPDGRTLKMAIDDAKRFIEEFRGKPFLRDVDVEMLDGPAFEDELLEGEDDPDADAAPHEEDFEATLRGLQLADPDDDLEESEDELLSDSVVGFYDDEAKRLVIRGGTLDVMTEQTLVHELAHAWQDQHFDLAGMWEDVDNQDQALALRALIEGDASRVETAWYERQPEEVQEEIDDREDDYEDDDGGDGTTIGASLNALYSFPYAVGEDFADAVAERGGNDALDDAFEDPPVSTAQVLFPAKYLEGDIPEDAIDPKPGGPVVDRGTLGAVGLIITIGFGEVPIPTYEGWDGDEYVTWERGGRTCTTVSVVIAETAQRDEIVEALRDRDLGTGGRVDATNDGLLLVSCED